jgi:acyl carrier protein
MSTKTRSFRPSPALLIACLALFMTLGGTALAVGVAKNSIRSAQIVDGTVRTMDLRDDSVNAPKIAANAVGAEEIAENAVASPEVAADSLTAGDLAATSVASSEVADNTLTANDLGPDSVGASEIQADAVGSSELAADSVRSSELAGIITAQNSTAIAANGNANVTATCPAGTTVISGGGSAGLYAIHLTSTYRSGNGWHIDARNESAATNTITAYAYCLAG